MYVICFLPAEGKLWTEEAWSKNCFLTPKVNAPVTAEVTAKETQRCSLKCSCFHQSATGSRKQMIGILSLPVAGHLLKDKDKRKERDKKSLGKDHEWNMPPEAQGLFHK